MYFVRNNIHLTVFAFNYLYVVCITFRLHDLMNICHLDLSLENIMICEPQNAFIQQKDGSIKMNQGLSIKICDFGLSEKFDISHPSSFECYKFGLKNSYSYSSPKIYQEEKYNAIAADIWSFGCMLYKLNTNKFLYTLPSETEDEIGGFKYLINRELYKFIKYSKLRKHIKCNGKLYHLLVNILNINQDERFTANQIITCPYFESYYKRYAQRIQKKKLLQQAANAKIAKSGKMHRFPIYSINF